MCILLIKFKEFLCFGRFGASRVPEFLKGQGMTQLCKNNFIIFSKNNIFSLSFYMYFRNSPSLSGALRFLCSGPSKADRTKRFKKNKIISRFSFKQNIFLINMFILHVF